MIYFTRRKLNKLWKWLNLTHPISCDYKQRSCRNETAGCHHRSIHSAATTYKQHPSNFSTTDFYIDLSAGIFKNIFCDSYHVLKYEIFFQLAFPQKLRPLLYLKLFESFKMSTHLNFSLIGWKSWNKRVGYFKRVSFWEIRIYHIYC